METTKKKQTQFLYTFDLTKKIIQALKSNGATIRRYFEVKSGSKIVPSNFFEVRCNKESIDLLRNNKIWFELIPSTILKSRVIAKEL